jgi:hypothetical protein
MPSSVSAKSVGANLVFVQGPIGEGPATSGLQLTNLQLTKNSPRQRRGLTVTLASRGSQALGAITLVMLMP